MEEKKLMKGNEAFAEAAIRGGCHLYFGYPITPQNEIPEYMSRELSKHGGSFVQAESELAAVNMAYGGALTGHNVFLSSSSPGIALMQEGISFMCSAEIPVVMLNISRGGPGVGGIQPGQADYRQATKGGGNGDYHVPVFAPASVQESVDLIYDAIPIAERYRNPVMILADGMLGQMMEPVTLPEHRAVRSEAELLAEKPWALNGHGDKRERMVIQSLHLKPEELEAHNMHLEEKYQSMRKELPKYQIKNCKDAEIVFVAFGTMSRIVNEAIDQLKTEGITAGLIRPITLWPFPEAAFDEIDPSTKVVISTELAIGQMMEDVKSAVAGRFPVELIYRTGGMVPTPMEVARRAKQILEAIR
ncbi:MAG: 3-methyl-2-oxobutanoate dehydrogenase subunit VorB [Firmicutes bacterium HGW-Firmicutes-11]|jgi:2-oxoglutarate ferredoxin oxidoreductase subunit alpha|nr:MAG: 3-methyl-2-oxobutanoate dehydrogenase subunit VorB [Firmicutes bacterium HGW-Firmicutes-11]